jgi:hypothetical protein
MSASELASVLRLQCAITDAEAGGFTYFAVGLRALLAQMLRGQKIGRPAGGSNQSLAFAGRN